MKRIYSVCIIIEFILCLGMMVYATKSIIEMYYNTSPIWAIIGSVICNLIIGTVCSLIMAYIAEWGERNQKQNEQNDKK